MRGFIIDWAEVRYTLAYCWRELFDNRTELVQWHRIEAVLWDCHNWHRELNSRNRRIREKARRTYQQRRGQK